MRRFLPALLFLSVSFGHAADSEKADAAAATKVKPKRVLFRTDSPRLFAPKTVHAKPPPPAPAAPKLTRTAKSASSRQSRSIAVQIVPARARTASPAVPRLPKPELPPRTAIITPLHDETQSAPHFDLDLQPTSFTPYDRYLGTVKSVIARLDERNSSMVTACELVQECRGFRYTISDLYRADPPAVTEARRAGDCKSKALWVYDRLGDASAYYVIGKLMARSRTSHAWIYWRNNGRWWILDPTVRSTPIAADSVATDRYVPYYSYSRAGAFRHGATRLMIAANGIPAVAPTTAVRERAADTRAAAPAR